ncbi:hypothetical protein B0A49_11387 [Cryomyces minteri]|uniref:Response regulatory domain-containing protein n=1 Tax=Cryomyces minteri TaxID=331657 RepID=A0A4U0W658_9PEZI|nr:hypothetical protein B0A49_11387 [Cryomyces minteri]
MPARAASAVGDSRPSSSPTDAANPTRPFTILMVDDNRINLQLLVTYMNRNRHTYETATNGLEAVETYKSHLLSHPQSPRPPSPSDASSAAAFESVVVSPSERPKAFDVVLMDISMPIMDGLEATRNIRQYERERGLKPSTVIALTGLASATAQQEAFSSGIDLFLTKPVRLKELTKILERVG